jgi:hypothetical protein
LSHAETASWECLLFNPTDSVHHKLGVFRATFLQCWHIPISSMGAPEFESDDVGHG